MHRALALVLISVLALPACVSQEKYTKLQNQYKKLEKENARLEAAASTGSSSSASGSKSASTGRNPSAEYKELKADLKPLIDRGLLSLEVVDGRVTIGMTSDILFASGSAKLSDQGRENVTEVARALARRAKEWDFQVEGHTDNDPINTPEFPDNWHLGAERAMNVMRAMINAGFPPDHLSAATFGQYSPVGSNDTPKGQARNRRIEIVLLPDLSTMPGYSDLMTEGSGRKRRN